MEECVKKDMNNRSSLEEKLVHNCLYGNYTCIMTMIVINSLYAIVLFLAWYVPVAALIGFSIAAGLGIMLTVMVKYLLNVHSALDTILKLYEDIT